MATNWKLVMFFATGGNGWTEDLYYVTQEELPITDDMKNLVVNRLAMLHSSGSMVSLRATQIDEPFASILYGSSIGTGPGTFAASTSPAVPWAGMLVRAYDLTSQYARSFDIRGISQALWGWVASAPETIVTLGTLAGPTANYLNYICNNSAAPTPPKGRFVGRARSGSQADKGTTKIITLTSPGINEPFTVTLTTPLDLAKGDRIQLTRIRGQGTKGANGIARITTVSTPGLVFVTDRLKVDDCTINYAKTGYLYKLVPNLWHMITATPERWVKRDEGRPIPVTRGRRRQAV